MRQLHLFRSQSPSGIRLEVELHQNPLVLYPLDPAEQNDGEHSRHLGATVVCSTGKKREIGGITVIRRVLVKRKFQNKWTPWETLQINETSVLQHCILDEGIHRFELSLPFPHNVPESRVTHHDRILHHVQAVLLDVPPTYLTASTSRLPSNLPVRSPSSKLGKISRKSKGKIAPTALALNQPLDRPELVDEIFEEGSESQHDVLATCSKTFEVVRSTGSKGDVPGINWGSMVRLPDSGKLYLRCSSDLFVLGSRLDFQLDFVNLGQDTTIHAVSAKLIQETGTPLKAELPDLSSPSASTTNLALPTSTTRDRPRRSGLGRLSSFLSSIKEKPPVPKSSVLDEYRLLGEGEDHVITPQGFLLRHGTNLWQGSISQAATEDESEAAPNAITPIFSRSRAQAPEIADSDLKAAVDGDEDSTQVTSSTLRMHRRVHLPSDIHGCCPTSDTLAPVLATVSHSLEVDVIYSIFGQDRLGKPLPPSGPQEGEMRLQRAMTEVNLAACTVGPATIQPPSYGPAHAATLTVPKSRPQASLSPIRRTLSRASSAYRKEPINKVVPKARTIPHSRSFKASNGVTVGAKAVFYPEGQLEEALIKHQQSHADCACGSEAPRFEVIVE